MNVSTLNTILNTKIATTESDIAEKTQAIINSAKRVDMSTNAVIQMTTDLIELHARLAALKEIASLTRDNP